MPLSEKTVDALLDKLSSDDDFRARFQANPREATRSLGTQDPAVDSLPDSPMPGLADKGALRGSRRRPALCATTTQARSSTGANPTSRPCCAARPCRHRRC